MELFESRYNQKLTFCVNLMIAGRLNRISTLKIIKELTECSLTEAIDFYDFVSKMREDYGNC